MAWETSHDPRYPANWQSISVNAKRMCPKCCYCLDADSKETHHVRYRDAQGLLLDRVIPGKDIFPVCESCHRKCHSKTNWVVNKSDNSKNKNRKNLVGRLKVGWMLCKIPLLTNQ